MQGSQDDESDQIQELADQQRPSKFDQASESSEQTDPRIYQMILLDDKLEESKKRLKKLQEKMASKQ